MICPHCGKDSEQPASNLTILPNANGCNPAPAIYPVINAGCAAQPNTLNHMAINPNTACAVQPATITYITFGGQQ